MRRTASSTRTAAVSRRSSGTPSSASSATKRACNATSVVSAAAGRRLRGQGAATRDGQRCRRGARFLWPSRIRPSPRSDAARHVRYRRSRAPAAPRADAQSIRQAHAGSGSREIGGCGFTFDRADLGEARLERVAHGRARPRAASSAECLRWARAPNARPSPCRCSTAQVPSRCSQRSARVAATYNSRRLLVVQLVALEPLEPCVQGILSSAPNSGKRCDDQALRRPAPAS